MTYSLYKVSIAMVASSTSKKKDKEKLIHHSTSRWLYTDITVDEKWDDEDRKLVLLILRDIIIRSRMTNQSLVSWSNTFKGYGKSFGLLTSIDEVGRRKLMWRIELLTFESIFMCRFTEGKLSR